MNKVTTFLWFNDQAAEAARFYVSLFPDSEILGANDQSVSFRLGTQSFVAFNGGPHFVFTPAISLSIDCADQAEVDSLWEKLAEGGEPSRCGWVTDRWGLSWQVVPRILGELLGDPDRTKAGRALEAMLKMSKLDISELKKAHAGLS